MIDKNKLKAQISNAFSEVEYPGDWCLRGSNEGDEPYLLEAEFKGMTSWRDLDPGFLDQAPDGYGTALSFFSDEAWLFYLPAYLIADVDGHLEQQDPVFQLTYGLTDQTRHEKVNPRRYGERTWFEWARFRFSVFSAAQAAAIVAYLEYRLEASNLETEANDIREALENYWRGDTA